MKYTLGLDIGITSVGWAIINNEKERIEDLGVRIFDAAEQPKTGDSLALPRREARITRRRLLRRKARLHAITNLFIAEGVLSNEEVVLSFTNDFNKENNLYELRHKALSEKITEQQFFRIVYLIVKRRGFKSSRKSQEERDVKNSVMLQATEENKKLIGGDILTIGQALYQNAFVHNNVLNRINNIKIQGSKIRESLELTKEEREKVLEAVYSLAYHDIKKALIEGGDLKETPECLLSDKDRKLFNDIAIILTIYKTDESIKEYLEKLALNTKTIEKLLAFSKEQYKSIRNKGGSYVHTLLRQNLYDELRLLIEKQREFSMKLSESFEVQLLGDKNDPKDMGLFGYQKGMEEGDEFLKKVGFCTFEKNEKRAPKASFSFWYFNVLNRINNIKIQGSKRRESLELTKDEREKVLEAVFSHKTINYSQIRKALELTPDETFNMVRYDQSQKKKSRKSEETKEQDETPKKEKDPEKETDLIYVKGGTEGKVYSIAYHDIKKALIEGGDLEDTLESSLSQKDRKLFNDIALILTIYKTDESIKEYLEKLALHTKTIEKLLAFSFDKFSHLSLEALNKIIPFLEEGHTYDEACTQAGYSFQGIKSEKSLKLPQLPKDEYSITSPVVKRAVTQTIRVVNALTKLYGAPFELHIELAREMSKDHQERNKIVKEQDDNRLKNEEIKATIVTASDGQVSDPKGQDILKYKLWQEQHCKCIYSGEAISERELFSDNYTQIDHIVPYSRSNDDSYTNKVLVLTSSNQEKRNQTPYEWKGGDESSWHEFEGRVKAIYGEKSNKGKKLLSKTLDPEGWKTRNLQDTRHATKFLKNYIEDHLLFSEGEKENKRRVVVVNGSATSYLRKRYGLAPKDRDANNLHHAVDACLVAVCGQDLIQKISQYEKTKELASFMRASNALAGALDPATNLPYTEEDKERARNYIERHESAKHIPQPWKNFREELTLRMVESEELDITLLKKINPVYHDEEFINRIKPIFVSRKLRKKETGQMHKETFRSAKLFDRKMSILKTEITKLTLESLENMYDKESDKVLYNQLKQRLLAHEKDPFKEPLYKGDKEFDKNGKRLSPVRSVKIIDPSQNSGFVIKRKDGSEVLVDNGSMLRVEIYKRKNKKDEYQFFTVPVYSHQVHSGSKTILPIPKKDAPKEIDESFEFMFTVYPNTLLEIIDEKEIVHAYYVKYNGSPTVGGAYSLIKHSDTSKSDTDLVHKNILNAKDIKKYYVDELGKRFEIKSEKRPNYLS